MQQLCTAAQLQQGGGPARVWHTLALVDDAFGQLQLRQASGLPCNEAHTQRPTVHRVGCVKLSGGRARGGAGSVACKQALSRTAS